MEPTAAQLNAKSRLSTYAQAVTFLFPPIFVWAISCVFIFPKLQTIWRDAGFDSSTFRVVFGASHLVADNGILFSLGVVVLLVVLEWRVAFWRRWRRVALGVIVFLLNTAVLVAITALLASAMVAAPMLAAK